MVKKKIIALDGSPGMTGSAVLEAFDGYEVRPETRNDLEMNENK